MPVMALVIKLSGRIFDDEELVLRYAELADAIEKWLEETGR